MQVLVDALEVWDYSRHNIQSYAHRVAEAQPRLRYLPFSFLSTKSGIALGVWTPVFFNTIPALCHNDRPLVECGGHNVCSLFCSSLHAPGQSWDR